MHIYIYVYIYIYRMCIYVYTYIYIYTHVCMYIYIYMCICASAVISHMSTHLLCRDGCFQGCGSFAIRVAFSTPLHEAPTGVCEINTHLDGTGNFTVPTPLPVFQSWWKDAQQQLTKLSVCFADRLHSPFACL